MIKTENFKKVEVTSQGEFRSWLNDHHTQDESVWLVTYKKQVEEKYVSTGQVLDELLCFGWIDGVRRKLDDLRTMQLIGPRRKQHWAKTYKDRAQRLINEGKMMPAGLKSIEVSKENCMWHFMDDVDALVKPDDLIQSLKEHPPALEVFNSFAPSVQRFTLRWIKLAKTEKTRKSRIEKTARHARRGEKIPGV